MTRRNAAPEGLLQKQVVDWLDMVLPPDILFSSTMGGVKLSMYAAVKARAQGLRRGVPDLVFVLPGGRTVWIEMKKPGGGTLSKEQKDWRDALGDSWTLCQSIEDVERALVDWGVILRRNHPFARLTTSPS